jgi:hypothetical protein
LVSCCEDVDFLRRKKKEVLSLGQNDFLVIILYLNWF